MAKLKVHRAFDEFLLDLNLSLRAKIFKSLGIEMQNLITFDRIDKFKSIK